MIGEFLSTSPGLYIALAWTLLWKGIALWKSARKNHIYWFVAFLILNTLGLLPIIYLIWLRARENKITSRIDTEAVNKVIQTKAVTRTPTKKKAAKKKVATRKKVSRRKK